MTKYLPFIEEALSYQQFCRVVLRWVDQRCANKLQAIYSSFKFKYQIKDLAKTPLPFIHNLIFYSCTKQLYWIFQNHLQIGQKWCSQTNIVIKETYQRMMMEGNIQQKKTLRGINNIRDDFNFLHFIVFAVKIVALFISQHFQQIKIELALEGQIYITLIQLLLGIDQGPRSYQVIRNKFIFKQNIKRGSLQLRKNQSEQAYASTLKSSSGYQRQTKRLITEKAAKRLKKKATNRLSFVKFTQQSTQQQINEFQNQLKKNLHVPPLLPVVKSKVKATDLFFIYQKKIGKDKHVIDSLEQKYKLKKIINNQYSNSFELQLSKTDFSSPNYTKGFYLSWRPQNLSIFYQSRQKHKLTRHQSMDSNNLCNLNLKKSQKNESALKNKKVQLQQWRQIIRRIKKNSCKNNNFKSSYDKENKRMQRKQLKRGFTFHVQHRQSQKQFFNTNYLTNTQGVLENNNMIKHNPNMNLESKQPIQEEKYIPGENCFYNIQQPWRYEQNVVQKKKQSKILKSKDLRNTLASFENESNFRNQTSKASTFAIEHKKPIKIGKI